MCSHTKSDTAAFYVTHFSIMNYDTTYLAGPLGLIALIDCSTRPNHSVGRSHLVQVISDLLFWCRFECDCHFHMCLNEPNWNKWVRCENTLRVNDKGQMFHLYFITWVKMFALDTGLIITEWYWYAVFCFHRSRTLSGRPAPVKGWLRLWHW